MWGSTWSVTSKGTYTARGTVERIEADLVIESSAAIGDMDHQGTAATSRVVGCPETFSSTEEQTTRIPVGFNDDAEAGNFKTVKWTCREI